MLRFFWPNWRVQLQKYRLTDFSSVKFRKFWFWPNFRVQNLDFMHFLAPKIVQNVQLSHFESATMLVFINFARPKVYIWSTLVLWNVQIWFLKKLHVHILVTVVCTYPNTSHGRYLHSLSSGISQPLPPYPSLQWHWLFKQAPFLQSRPVV